MSEFHATFNPDMTFNATFEDDDSMNATFEDTQIVETGDYNKLANHPLIEGNELIGDKSFEQLGMRPATVQEVEAILYLD